MASYGMTEVLCRECGRRFPVPTVLPACNPYRWYLECVCPICRNRLKAEAKMVCRLALAYQPSLITTLLMYPEGEMYD
jgi:uncharacterized protein YbaR (Trm112 family)